MAERKLTASSVELTVAPFPGLGEAMDRTQAADGFGLSIDDEGGRVAILPVWAEHNDPNFKDDLRVWVKREGWDSFVECVRLGACGTWDELISASLDPSPENTVTASAEITVKPWTWRQKIRLALRRLADGQATLRRIL